MEEECDHIENAAARTFAPEGVVCLIKRYCCILSIENSILVMVQNSLKHYSRSKKSVYQWIPECAWNPFFIKETHDD